jgi:hypothetical protein
VLKSKKKIAAIALVSAVVLIWAGAFLALVLFKPNLAQWTAIVTTCALLSEAALWAGVALLGLTALDKFRIWARIRRKS